MQRIDRLTRRVLHRRVAVGLAWLAVTVAGVAAGIALPSHLTALTTVPGSESARADALLREHFGDNNDGAFTIVVPFGNASDVAITDMRHRLEAAVAEVPSATVVEQRALGGVLYALAGTRLSLLDAADTTDELRAALARHDLPKAMVTGPPALEHDVRPVLADDLRNGTLAAIGLSLVLLIIALGWSWAVLVPFAVAAAVVAATLLTIFAVAQRIAMVLYIPNVIELIGLGLAIDFALLIVHRHRQELTDDGDLDEAIVRTMRTAGRTVTVSAVTAAIGLSVLFLLPIPFVRSLGVAGMLVPLFSLLAALTLQPVLLRALGPRGAVAHGWHGVLHDDRAKRGWETLSRLIRRRPRHVLAASLTGLLIAAAPMAALQLAPASLTAIPQHLESARAVAFLSARVGPGAITPHQLVVDVGAAAAGTPAADAARTRLATSLSHLPGVFAVVSDTTPLFVDETGRYQRIVVMSTADFADPAARALVERLRTVDPRASGYAADAAIHVGGAPAQGYDFLQRVYAAFPWLVLASLVFAFVVLSRAFRSRLLPALAVLLNLASVSAAIGVVVLIFHFGVGAGLIHAQTAPRIEGWSLVFLFAMLFGLSMDYQVFLLSRIREARDSGLEMRDAVAVGVSSTGGVITAAAVIFVCALSGLVFGHIAGLQELGVGLAAGVLIDATVVRSLLLPAALTLLGDRIR